jgi:hypothetical protein
MMDKNALLKEKSVRQNIDGHMSYLVNLTNSLLTSFAVSGLVILAICLIRAVLSESIKMFTFLPFKYPAIFSACGLVMEMLNCFAYFSSSSAVILPIL